MNRPTRSPEEEAARRARIERLAHEIWESEGRPEGQSLRHWSMAERLVEAEEHDAGPPASGAARPRANRNGKRPAP
ncbi:DUF2934 domain-containing protein [Vulcaniibacterium tengchongense]|uniref:DUF2934 family protein n=1 Tax=Vulcaniibacterium tengchongense TaxID=1273429 RepID=A0A3N4VCC9_9GAMM|nr:DUF2934 domain-containing protein [Vulcaniibacterium tengchongense]RPE74797.1 DUF2934 family protein [Vulcaniibacterium tengchongense]